MNRFLTPTWLRSIEDILRNWITQISEIYSLFRAKKSVNQKAIVKYLNSKFKMETSEA